MKNILIVGAGGLGREIYCYIEDCIEAGAQWRIKGFLDDNPAALAAYDYPHDVVGSVGGYAVCEGDFFISALGLPKVRKIVCEKLLERGAKFETLVHPTVRLGRNVKIGAGCVIAPGSFATCDVSIGDFVFINNKVSLGHDSKVGAWATVSSFCDITGFAEVGEGAFLGSSCVAMPKSKIGEWSVVGANSSVVGKIRGGTTVYGNPAVKM